MNRLGRLEDPDLGNQREVRRRVRSANRNAAYGSLLNALAVIGAAPGQATRHLTGDSRASTAAREAPFASVEVGPLRLTTSRRVTRPSCAWEYLRSTTRTHPVGHQQRNEGRED